MEITRTSKSHRRAQRGMALIELLIAILVLIFGMVGLTTVILAASISNTRNRTDNKGTLLAQTVMEYVSSQSARTNSSLSISDCAGNTWTVNTAGAAAPGSGATLYTASTAPFSYQIDWIDWTQSSTGVPAGYQMDFVTCNSNNIQVVYDVRWNVETVSGTTKMVTVSARQKGTRNSPLRFYAPPVVLRSVVGQVP